jgi:hypothetical protein
MSVQPSLNSSNMVVAEIINEINSTQPSGNYSQNTRVTPAQNAQQPQPQMPAQNAQNVQQPQPQMPAQNAQQPQLQRMPVQNVQQQPQRMPVQNVQQQPQRRATPFRRPQHSQPTQKTIQRKSFLQKQKEKMRNKKVRFKEEVEERVIQERDSESESESESESDDTPPIENIAKSKKTSNTKLKFLKKDDVKKNDLTETKGFYSRVINFFTNDTKEPLLVLTLVFTISMPIVNKLMERFLPFLMKYGEGSLFVVGVKALVVALVFFAVKKLLL